MELKKLYSQALNHAIVAIRDAEIVKNRQLKLSPEDYNNPDDYEQEKQENADSLYNLNVYKMHLEMLADSLLKTGIPVK